MPAASAAELHGRALSESARGRHGAAHRLLRTALRRDPDPVRRARILVSLAYHEAEKHDLAAGLALLDEADRVPDLPVLVRGVIEGQRGMLFMRAGAAADATAAFDAALDLLDGADPQELCRALLNRGVLHLRLGRTAAARADFTRLADLATRHGFEVTAAKASHNLGYLSLREGDLPRALRELDTSDRVLGGQSPAFVGIYHLDRAEVLLAAGLFREADEDLVRAAELFRAGRMTQDLAAAELTRAQVAVFEERWRDARVLAGRAGRRFTRRGAQTWALLAASVAVTADVADGRPPRVTAPRAARLAAGLSAAGLDDEARRAALTAATARLALGDVAGAREVAGGLRRDDSAVVRLHAREVRARLAEAEGAGDRVDAELRAALRELHRYQSSFGSLDLQTAVTGHGRRLAEWGLDRALASGRPARVFGWAERARALSARLAPVTPPADPEVAGLLEELRYVRTELRRQTLTGRPDLATAARRIRLERQIRQHSWRLSGPGGPSEPAPLARLRDELLRAGATFVAHLVCRDRLQALVIGPGRPVLADLGPAGPAVELRHRLRADLDALAVANLPPPIRTTVQASLRDGLRALAALLWTPVRRLAGDGPLLLAPSAVLATVPWTLLPPLAGRPLSVVASATAWLAARSRAALPSRPRVVMAAGPRVPRAGAELGKILAEWPSAVVLREARTAGVLEAAGRADVLHVAAHGVHEPDSPLFSYLELADGPLFGHELEQVPRLPGHVVLSACELGLARTRPGDETLGMTAVLLHGGTGSVVAGVARIGDDVACQVAAAHHAGLRRGQPPAAALAAALGEAADGTPAPLVCFGAGW